MNWTHARSWLESTGGELRHAARIFRRSPVLTAVMVATLAIGIGASTAVFSVVDRLLFRSLPYGNPDRLVSFGITGPIDENEFMLGGSYVRWSPHLRPFESATSLSPWVEGDLGDENPIRVRCIPEEANFLRTFGLSVAAGRDFTRDDDRPHAARVALISYDLWKSRFAADRSMLGHTVTLDDQPTRIVGVLPQDFELPTLGRADVLIPQQLDATAELRGATRFLRTFARLKPGVSLIQARQELRPLFQSTLQTEVPPPLRPEVHLAVRSLRDRQVSDVRLASWLLFGAVLALLLIACANAANLLLARSAARQREWAMRAALGAGRGRLIRQALAESLVLALAGAAVGCLFARLLLRVLLALAPEGLLHLHEATLDARVLGFALLISIAAALLFGIAPALQTPRSEALTGWRSTTGERRLLRHLLVGVQIAISLVLLSGASLFVRSFLALQHQALGLEPARTVAASFELSHHSYQTPEKLTSFYNQLEAKLSLLPGVTDFALTDSVPPGGWIHLRPFSNLAVLGKPPLASAGGTVLFRYVSSDYFRVLRIPILQGRALNEADRTRSQNSIVLSVTLSRRIFGTQNPLGHQLIVDPHDAPLTIVGIAADVKNNGLENPPEPEYYKARKRTPDSGLGSRGVALIKSAVPPQVLSSWIRAQVASLDPRLAVTIETLRQRVDEQADRPRFITVLVGLFAVLGLVLAAVGLYGVMAFLVNQQTREIGIRMAVGATPASIAGFIFKHAAAWTAGGMVLGLCASFTLTRLARSLLFRVSPNDPLSLFIAAVVLASAAFLATIWPSRRASKVDPAVLLRAE